MRFLEIAVDGGVATVTFDRPPVNAVDLEVIDDFLTMVARLGEDRSVRAVVLTGAGTRFCAGADVAMMRDLSEANHRRVRRWVEVQSGLEALPKPVIAAINGYALGGGCELALACDVRLASPDVQLGQPEVRLGIIPGAGAPHRLTRAVGTGLARELIFTGRLVGAEEALRIGLVNRIVAPPLSPLDAARDMMRDVLKNAPMAVRLAKVALNAAVNTVDRRSTMVEYLSQGILFESDEKKKRMTAFLEKKKP